MDLREKSVLCIGAGGLGSPAALFLAAAGVGRIGICDADLVDESNLQRQILHGTADVGRSKVKSARDRLLARHPSLHVSLFEERFDTHNALQMLRTFDVVVDGSDNFRTKFLANDACVLAGVPLVHGGILRWFGQLFVVVPGRGACYRCIFEAPPPLGEVPSCAEAGVVGALAGTIGSLMAVEALKLLTGEGAPLVDRLLTYDAMRARFREVPLQKNPRCAVCGDAPTLTHLRDDLYLQGECRDGVASAAS